MDAGVLNYAACARSQATNGEIATEIVFAALYGGGSLLGFVVGLNLLRLAYLGAVPIQTPLTSVGIWIVAGWLALQMIRRTNGAIGLIRTRF